MPKKCPLSLWERTSALRGVGVMATPEEQDSPHPCPLPEGPEGEGIKPQCQEPDTREQGAVTGVANQHSCLREHGSNRYSTRARLRGLKDRHGFEAQLGPDEPNRREPPRRAAETGGCGDWRRRSRCVGLASVGVRGACQEEQLPPQGRRRGGA